MASTYTEANTPWGVGWTGVFTRMFAPETVLFYQDFVKENISHAEPEGRSFKKKQTYNYNTVNPKNIILPPDPAQELQTYINLEYEFFHSIRKLVQKSNYFPPSSFYHRFSDILELERDIRRWAMNIGYLIDFRFVDMDKGTLEEEELKDTLKIVWKTASGMYRENRRDILNDICRTLFLMTLEEFEEQEH